jgi:O-antigen/teichoic acid export membrane protein
MQISKAAVTLGSLHMASMALAFLVGALLARILGPSNYGIYALAMVIVTFAGMVVEFGLPILSMREFARALESGQFGAAKGLIRWTNVVILTLWAVLAAACALLMRFGEFDGHRALLLTLAWGLALIPLTALAKIRGLALLAMGRVFGGQFAVLIVRPAVFALMLGILWLSLRSFSPAAAMAAQVIGAAVALTVVAAFYRHFRPPELREALPITRARAWTMSALPMGATEGFRLVQGQAALLLLGLMATNSAVGLFRVADASSVLVLVPATIINVVAGPQFARLSAARDRAAFQKTLSFVSLAIFLAVGALALPLLCAGGWLVTFAFGPEFADSVPALLTLACGWILVTILGPCVTLANMIGEERAVTVAMAVAIAVQVTLASFLIPRIGIVGAAVSAISGQLALNGTLASWVYRRARLNATIFSIGSAELTRVAVHVRELILKTKNER